MDDDFCRVLPLCTESRLHVSRFLAMTVPPLLLPSTLLPRLLLLLLSPDLGVEIPSLLLLAHNDTWFVPRIIGLRDVVPVLVVVFSGSLSTHIAEQERLQR